MKKKILLSSICLLIIIGLLGGASYLISLNQYKNAIDSITYKNINASNISDGTYLGDCNVDFIYAKVKVTVKNGNITDIELIEHKNERGTPAEQILQDIVEQQIIDVDAVSGATNSSKVIKKAIDNALSNSIK